MNADTIIQYGARIMIIFMILPIHEFAHAYVAYKLGDNTAMYKGRLTMNPLAHIDIIGAICLLFTGFGWAKPVPINPLKFKKYRAGIAYTALAGPLSNLIVAFVSMIGLRVLVGMNDDIWFEGTQLWYYTGVENTAVYYAVILLMFIVTINIGLAIFNLLPIPPLDGSKILSYFTSAKYEMFLVKNQIIIQVAFFAVMFSGILSGPLGFLRDKVFSFYMLCTNWIEALVK